MSWPSSGSHLRQHLGARPREFEAQREASRKGDGCSAGQPPTRATRPLRGLSGLNS